VRPVRVNRKAYDRIASGHPWIFASDIVDRGDATPGDAVFVLDPKERALGTFHYSSTSQIALRRLSARQEPIDKSFFLTRIRAALEHRARTVRESDAYRVVFGEADLLPALVVDRYADTLAVQTLSQGMDRAKGDIVAALCELLKPRAVVERNDVAVRRHEQLPLSTGLLAGEMLGPIAVRMNGLEWEVDVLAGQKTGIYLDQRENYLAAARHARGNALDCFTSTGGFALHLARTCESVEAVDSSEQALATAAANARRNGLTNIGWREADVFDVLASHAQAGRRFDTIVLDPPAFTKSRSAVEGAARGYREINQRALRLLGSGGVLITCSCSHHFSEAMLLQTVAEAALDAGRTLRVLERRMQSGDHPVLLTVPETLYLKCLILQVV
jgi:23S rRNA (cytosine1962-C5)-methyltransferase